MMYIIAIDRKLTKKKKLTTSIKYKLSLTSPDVNKARMS